jgi:alpha,alpha-trehalose-phosphate synthase [UDP-forming]/trehalose-phosphatase
MQALREVVTSERLAIVTDLDGTLVPIEARPELAVPAAGTTRLLLDLAELEGVTVTIASGRPRPELEAMFADAPTLTLVAEHGAWLREQGAWRATVEVDPAPLRRMAEGLERLAAPFQGAFVERKTWGFALHHRLTRASDKEGLRVSASALLDEALAAHPELERIEGKELLEVRVRSVHKGTAVERARAAAGGGARVLALGDDLTDEDMFRALAAHDAGVFVAGDARQPSAAGYRVAGVDDVHALLEWVRDARRGSRAAAPACAVDERGLVALRARFDLLVVSNRLPELRAPVTTVEDGRKKKVGGLVSALTPALTSRRGVWLGWSGRTVADGAAERRQSLDVSCTPALSWMDFPRAWQERYYDGLCNAALWPLLHSFVGRVRYEERDLAAYREVNAAFAEAAERLITRDATVWIHDYHLLLLGAELRRRAHAGPIGLFLHVPFCAPDLFFVLPCADELLRALLALDVVGFHTAGYVENFLRCAARLPGARVEGDVVRFEGRVTRAGVFPIGIIPEQFQPRSDAPAPEIEALLQAITGRRLVLGVDRLDYTKGIPERLTAFGRLLATCPEWRRKVCLVQVSVPSRADVPEYAQQRARVEQIVGNINGDFGEADWVPIRYLYRSYGMDVLAQLYRAADVGYVTPLRDGMNLVAKEYVAAQDPERPGALLLSRFAGAADELDAALLTNPYDVEGMARDLDRALRMDLRERRERHAFLRAAVERTTALTWAEDFLRALQRGVPEPDAQPLPVTWREAAAERER